MRRTVAACALALAILEAAVVLPQLIHNILVIQTDYGIHLELARQMVARHAILIPYFLWAFSVIGVAALPGISFAWAAVVVSAGFAVLTVLAAFWAILTLGGASSQRDTIRSAALAFGCTLVGPISLFTYPSLYFGYVNITVYNNPTIGALRPFAIATFLGLVALLSQRSSWRIAIGTTLAAVLSVLAKPSYLVFAGPAAAAFAAFRPWQRAWPVLAALVPEALLMLWQYQFHYLYTGPDAQGGFAVAPFAAITCNGSVSVFDVVVRFGLSIAFPIAVYAAFADARRRFWLNFAWATFALTALAAYLLVEGLACAGNLFWSAQITSFVLFLASAAYLSGRLGDVRTDRRVQICVVLFALHLASGLAFYVQTLTHRVL